MRVATLDVTPQLFVEFGKFCKDGPPRQIVVKKNALPDDAKIVKIGLRENHPYTWQLFIESETFADVPDGSTPPELPPVWFETVYSECSALIA